MIITNQHHRDLDPLLYGDLSLGLFLQTLSCHPSSWGTGSIIMAASCFTYQWRKIQTDWFKQIVLWQTLRGSDYLLPPPVFGRGRCLHARAQTHKHTHTHTHTHAGRAGFWLQGSIFWSQPCFDVFRRRRINPKHLGTLRTDAFWAVWLCFCASWLSLTPSMREYTASSNNLIHCYNQMKCDWAIQAWGEASWSPGRQNYDWIQFHKLQCPYSPRK